MTYFKRVYMSCVSNSLSSQGNLYVPVVTTGNANAANEALTIGRACAALQKYASPFGECTTAYAGILWNVLGILLSGEMVSLEKHPVFLDCYRLALERASSCKILLQCMTVFIAVQCERGTGNHQVEGVPNSRVGVRCEHRQIVSQLSHQNFRVSSRNVGTMRG